MTGRPAEPTIAALGGRGLVRRARRAALATRPQFLTASALPVLLGTAWGAATGGGFHATACGLALAATLLVHAGSNVLNDVGDALGGSDAINTSRVYPFTGGSRFIQNGILSVSQMRRLACLLLGLAIAAGLALAVLRGWTVVGFGTLGLSLGILYSLPGPMLAGRGLGEVAVGTAFGLLPVTGAAWLQAPAAMPGALLLGVPVAAWVMALLLINEVPDIAADRAAGKRTLPVRVGRYGTAMLFAGLQCAAFAGVIAWQQMAGLSAAVLVAPGLLLPLGLLAARSIAGHSLPLLAGIQAALTIHALGCIALTAAILLSVRA